jgi:transketolase
MPSRRELANAIRFLSMDAVQEAKSGHPGAPMGMADIAEVLWNDHLVHNPRDPHWPNRDRFVLSNGHGSMLLYSLLHLTGYDLSLEELKNFRQLHSKTPGHPEFGLTPGVETTTGPLGQGLANAVGMALAEKMLARRFNRGGKSIVDHMTYVFLGDGCMMEGISHEACSLAGTLGLGKLVAFYDDNGISIDGPVQEWFRDDSAGRFEAYGWHVVREVDGHDSQAVDQAIRAARQEADRPSLICCRTTIAWGAPSLAGSHESHGAPLGSEEIQGARLGMSWSHEPFTVPEDVYSGWNAVDKGEQRQKEWEEAFASYEQEHPELAAEFRRVIKGELPAAFGREADAFIRELADKGQDMATRKASKEVLEGYGPRLPELVGGSADLSGSNKTIWSGSRTITRDSWDGNYIHFGVREFGMAAIASGIALHGGLIPYVGTFLVFSDYARNGIRMAALMGLRNIFVLTHDSIGVGEDGPTHQPIEHAASLRLIPNLHVWRPCDTVECGQAWKAALERQDGPSCLLLTRQSLAHQHRSEAALENMSRGGYVLKEEEGQLEGIIVATGSEVEIAVQAARMLEDKGRSVRVVSMPCVEIFEAQDREYRTAVLPDAVTARVVVEAGVTRFWEGIAGPRGKVLGIDRFGESAPGKALFDYFDLTSGAVAQAMLDCLE